ncbi:MAG: hypothetical protein ACOYNI_09830 [Acidimicrobiia bacterium]
MNTDLEDIMRDRLGDAAGLFEASGTLEPTTARRVRNRRRRDITVTSVASLALVAGIGGAGVALLGGNDSSRSNRVATDPSDTTTTVDTTTTTAPETTVPTTTTAAPAPAGPTVVDEQFDESNAEFTIRGTGVVPRLEGTSVAGKVNATLQIALRADYIDSAESSVDLRYRVVALTPAIYSVQVFGFYSPPEGGAHGGETATSYTFDLETGDPVALNDVITDAARPAIRQFALDDLARRDQDIGFFPWVADDAEFPFGGQDSAAWAVGKDGLHLTWRAGTVAAYGTLRAQEVVVPWSVVGDNLTGKVDPNTL